MSTWWIMISARRFSYTQLENTWKNMRRLPGWNFGGSLMRMHPRMRATDFSSSLSLRKSCRSTSRSSIQNRRWKRFFINCLKNGRNRIISRRNKHVFAENSFKSIPSTVFDNDNTLALYSKRPNKKRVRTKQILPYLLE